MSRCDQYAALTLSEPKTTFFKGFDCSNNAAVIGKGFTWLKETPVGRNELSSLVKAPHHTLVIGSEDSNGQPKRESKYVMNINNARVITSMSNRSPFGNDDANWVELRERKPWSRWKVDACTGRETPTAPFTPGSSTCDRVMTDHCRQNPKDDDCACLVSEIPLASCFDTRCVNTSAYKTSALLAQAAACPTYMDCKQYLTLDKGASSNVLHANYLNQTCIAPSEPGTNVGGGTTPVSGGGYTPVGGGAPVYTPPSGPSSPPVPPVFSSGSGSEGGISTTMIILIVVIAIIFIGLLTFLAFSGEDEPKRPQVIRVAAPIAAPVVAQPVTV
jgi:hypothetical protein